MLIFVSCSENKEARELFAKVESVMEEHPDSSLTMLDSAYAKKEDWNTSQQMKYELLRAKAQNKAYVDFTTDSIMLKVAEYYDAHGTPNEQMEAHYLLGCTYRDMHEAPMALSCYLDATEKADTLSDDCDYRTLMRIWGQVADEFGRQAMPYKELEALKKYQDYAINCADSFNYIVGIELETRPYLQLKDTASAIKSQDKSFQLFKKHNLESDAARSIANLIPILLDRRQIHDAKMKIDFFESVSGLFDSNGEIGTIHSRYYYNKGYYYLCVNKLDSAEYFYRKLLKHDYLLDAYKGLLSVFKLIKNADSINKYSVLEEEAFVKSYSRLHTQAMFNADGMFNYARNQRIAIEKERDANRNHTKVAIVSVLSICLVLLGIGLFARYKQQKRKELETITCQYTLTKQEYNKALEEYSLMEKEFEVYKEMKAKEIAQLQESNEKASATYERANRRNILTSLCSNEVVMQILKNENIGHNHHSEISNEQWDSVYALFKEEVPQLYCQYINNPQLSDRERKTLVLTCLGINTKNMAILLNTATSNISNIKKCINQKLFLDASAKKLFDNIISA